MDGEINGDTQQDNAEAKGHAVEVAIYPSGHGDSRRSSQIGHAENHQGANIAQGKGEEKEKEDCCRRQQPLQITLNGLAI